ncbi:carbohydrate ABC transporter ATP-binding protein, CUT1 family [Psychromonas ingrahamii 37]|uniref:Carbohydrate ABC transporter ATP-binding protein, CUT1 family n=1 Tax=Psychromonas ingrahamii (strain DSM 17664 / CCUG 51855 / 37) TaxID=357804 RepID=A1SXL8_PSYIN|nr:sn-glycerol-3-phosphate ABC transporter ATP-binding protein UgpC [Psychromonas ingrahamii]ABM04233.1 carbohydrate ABC transporter ATP-binding protein, CUT1 family [Psychromonas ingrahamii 37]
MSQISLKKIVKNYGSTNIIKGIDLEINSGEFVVFVGPSGCGKSTLLRMIAGLEDISGGELTIEDQLMNKVDASERGVAMVFQSYALYPHMTVAENIGFSIKMAGKKQSEIDGAVSLAAKSLQLTPLLDRKPANLSGGQRQRVAIGRAIVKKPKVFLFDEPLSNLDAELRVDMRLEIARLHREMGATMVYVTHDQTEAMTLADKIVVLRAGNIEQVGSPIELYKKPNNTFVAGFIGSPQMNMIPAKIYSLNGEIATIELGENVLVEKRIQSGAVNVGDEVLFGIRPEHISLEKNDHVSLPMTVRDIERLGNSTCLFGNFSTYNKLKVHLSEDQELKLDSEIEVFFNGDDSHIFYRDNRISL